MDVLAVNDYKPQINRYLYLQFCVTDATFDFFIRNNDIEC